MKHRTRNIHRIKSLSLIFLFLKDEEEEEFEWIDVLVEMLLNLFTINTSSIRNTVKNQFKKLLPKLTVNSIKLIVDVIFFLKNSK